MARGWKMWSDNFVVFQSFNFQNVWLTSSHNSDSDLVLVVAVLIDTWRNTHQEISLTHSRWSRYTFRFLFGSQVPHIYIILVRDAKERNNDDAYDFDDIIMKIVKMNNHI